MLERTAVFIDGPNLYAAARALNFSIDYKALKVYLNKSYDLIRCYYYTAVIDTVEDNPIIKLVDYLEYNGFTVRTKDAKQFHDPITNKLKTKGNMDIELAVDALELAPHIQHILLFSGDGDFEYLVEAIQRKGVKVTVCSTFEVKPPLIADELRRQADAFLELATLAPVIGRRPG